MCDVFSMLKNPNSKEIPDMGAGILLRNRKRSMKCMKYMKYIKTCNIYKKYSKV